MSTQADQPKCSINDLCESSSSSAGSRAKAESQNFCSIFVAVSGPPPPEPPTFHQYITNSTIQLTHSLKYKPEFLPLRMNPICEGTKSSANRYLYDHRRESERTKQATTTDAEMIAQTGKRPSLTVATAPCVSCRTSTQATIYPSVHNDRQLVSNQEVTIDNSEYYKPGNAGGRAEEKVNQDRVNKHLTRVLLDR